MSSPCHLGRYALTADELGVPVSANFYFAPRGDDDEFLRLLRVGVEGVCPSCKLTLGCLEKEGGAWWTLTGGGQPVRHADVSRKEQ